MSLPSQPIVCTQGDDDAFWSNACEMVLNTAIRDTPKAQKTQTVIYFRNATWHAISADLVLRVRKPAIQITFHGTRDRRTGRGTVSFQVCASGFRRDKDGPHTTMDQIVALLIEDEKQLLPVVTDMKTSFYEHADKILKLII